MVRWSSISTGLSAGIATGGYFLFAACAGRDSATSEQKAALLRSADTIAVYDAGVDAYRSQRLADARDYWQRAAELGDREAASNLGYLLYYGHGGPPDAAAARALWDRAMAARAAEAHRHVAQAILDGDEALGTVADGFSHAVAASVLGRTSDQPDDGRVARDAEALVERLRQRLTVSDQVLAERRGRAWAEKYPMP